MKMYHFCYLAVLVLLLSISGCYMKPVRHLAADIALLRVGETTQEDVVVFLGEPDEEKQINDAVVKWLYVDKDQSLLYKTPLIGESIGSSVYRRAVVTIKNGIVVDAIYTSSDNSTRDWADDYSWQVEKK